jgi:hypothetical protein
MRNISAVQRPMPLTSTNAAISASSSMLRQILGSSAPDAKCVARSRRYSTFAPGQAALAQRELARRRYGAGRGASGREFDVGRDCRDETLPDRFRGLDRYLLAHDRPGERRERVVAVLDVDARIGCE